MQADVSKHNLDRAAMGPYFDQIAAILGGAATMRASKQYLPKFPNETEKDHKFRRENAKFTNVFRDIVENLAAKPFAEELSIKDDAPSQISGLLENIDGEGNHLHVFAADTFFHGLAFSMDWVLVDWTKTDGQARTIADERRIGARPYWVHIRAQDMIAVETAKVEGRMQFTHCRFYENTTARDGYEEKPVERIREIERLETANGWSIPVWRLWEKTGDDNLKKWEMIDTGLLSINEIPLIPFVAGWRKGQSWQTVPMLRDAADLQIELFQQESGLKYAKENTAFPMLAGNGVQPPIKEDGTVEPVPVGPKSVLYAPPNGEGEHGEWQFIEPGAQSLKFLAEDVKETINQLRELGRQPLTAQTGNLTTVTTHFAAQKGNSAVMAAALNLKDCLENAFRYTAMWLQIEFEPEIEIFTDFDLATNDGNGPETLMSMRATGDISQDTLWTEMKRRGVLSANFDPETERDALEQELPSVAEEQELLDAGIPPASNQD